jgi:hypothetical protein
MERQPATPAYWRPAMRRSGLWRGNGVPRPPDLRCILIEPKPPHEVWIAGQNDDQPSGQTPHFSESGIQIRPLMNRKRRYAGVEVPIRKRQRLRHRIDRWAEVRPPLGAHGCRWFDGGDREVRWFVGPAPASRFSTDRAPPSAARMTDAMRGSGCRNSAYPEPITT